MAREPLFARLIPEDVGAVNEWFVRDHARDHGSLQRAWYRRVLKVLESWILPGVQLHYVARKRVLERQVTRAIDAGAAQVVVIAGGFDTLAYRLHSRFGSVRFFELDHPATQASKRQTLQTYGAVQQNLILHPVDLTKTKLADALTAASVDASKSTIVIAEGVLMYLKPDQVAGFVASVEQFFKGCIVLALTFMVPDAKGRSRFHNSSRLLDAWLSIEGEPFLSAFTHEQLRALLTMHGFGQIEFWDHERLRVEALPPEMKQCALAIGENICLARRDGRG